MKKGKKKDREKVLEFLKENEGENFTNKNIEKETEVSVDDVETSGILE